MRLVRQFVALLWEAAKWQVVWAVLLSTLLSFTEGVSLAIVFPLITLLGNPAQTSIQAGRHTQWVFHVLAGLHLPQTAWLPALLLVVVAAVGLLAQLNGIFSSLSVAIVMKVRVRLAEQLYRGMLHADWVFLTRRRSSDLTHLLADEVNRVGTMANSLVAVLSNGMVCLLLLSAAVYLAPVLAMIVGVCFALMLPLQRRSARAIQRAGAEQSEKVGAVYSSATEPVQNLKVIKAYGVEDAELALFTRRFSEAAEWVTQGEWKRNIASRRFQLFSLGVLCGLILAGLNLLHLSPEAMLLFLFAFTRASPRLNILQSKANEFAADVPAYRNAVTFLAECEANSELSDTMTAAPELRKTLAFRGVSFSYGAGGGAVLHELDLELRAGEMTAIAGFSGAGKSTVADLVMGLLVPGSGEVNVDGRRITRENARAWRRRVGYVSQDTLLFHATVRENLRWAAPEASEAQVQDALARAQAGFVLQLPQGMDTVVGDRGMMLSHGQRQRIALARAFLLEPELLILDEATNSLDLENEESVLRSVRKQDVTTLLISHRPSALRMAHRIFLLKGGQIEAAGSWDQVRSIVEQELPGV